MTHEELVSRASKWLFSKGYQIVITELTSCAYEIPDAIGFSSSKLPIVVECKTSVTDYYQDKQKHFRMLPENGMGSYRYYMIPKGLFKPDIVEDKWGLIEVGHNCKVLKEPTVYIKRNKKAELQLMISALRRIGHNSPLGVNIKTYPFLENGKCKATLGTLIEDDYCI